MGPENKDKRLNRLAEVLEEQGRTQRWLARQLKVSHVTISNYCLNLSQPTLAGLYQIATVLQIDPRDLLNPTLKLSPKAEARTRKDGKGKPDKGTDNSDPDASQ